MNTSASDHVRSLFSYFDDYAIFVSCKDNPNFGQNCEVKYQFSNNSSLRIWTDRSDVYLEIIKANGDCRDLKDFLKRRISNLHEYSDLVKLEFELVKSWLGI